MMGALAAWWRARVAAVTSAMPAAQVAAPRVREEIDRGRRQVEDRVDALRTLTEREILACGRVLSGIVETARTIIADNDGALAAALTRSDASTTRFIGEMQRDIQAQGAAVAQVLSLADAMQEAISAIDSLSQYSDLLSINARIEAARIGEAGAGFAVIAEQMRQLSGTIRGAAVRVGTAIGAVRAGMPPVRERASAMQERARAFIEVVAQEMKGGLREGAEDSAGGHRLEAVMRLSNEALSHLQFQDPLVQELTAINRDFAVLSERVTRLLAGETVPEAQAQLPHLRQAAPESGKVTCCSRRSEGDMNSTQEVSPCAVVVDLHAKACAELFTVYGLTAHLRRDTSARRSSARPSYASVLSAAGEGVRLSSTVSMDRELLSLTHPSGAAAGERDLEDWCRELNNESSLMRAA